ncbi:MAG: hypothetical protein JO241_00815 [Candidatus Eremiobacteraeota bacterium]|nr:hypothetical protein [Candidatus Eremiobacteraeota bacterium]
MLTAVLLASLVASAPARLEIAPWSGKDLVTTTTSAAKYRLVVTGRPNAKLHLAATEVADGWLGAFCTPTVCAPMQVDLSIPKSGQAILQFELIRESDMAPGRSGARIAGDDGSWVDVPPATR